MTDNLSESDRKKTMRAVKSTLTGPERRLRSMLAGMGISGFRMNYAGAPGKPDVAFPTRKVAVFVDGCFWHGCPVCDRPLPETNREYWTRKIARNIARDWRYDEMLAQEGWLVLRIWGHELKKRADLSEVATRIADALDARQGG